MKPKRIAGLLLLQLLALAPLTTLAADPAKEDLARLQGEWTMVSGSAGGAPVPPAMLTGSKRICQGDELTVILGGQPFFKAQLTLDPSKTPKTIDYEMTSGFTKGKRQLGIYELEGDTLKSCFGSPGAERPNDFTTKPGDGRTLSVWKRSKASPPPH